jgi:predicted phage terminase large subunit-like protein
MSAQPEPDDSALEPLLRAALARQSLLDFCGLMDPKYESVAHTNVLIEHLEALDAREIDRLMVHMPPRHSKPVSVDAQVLTGDGSYKRLGDISVGDQVISHTGVPRAVEAVFEQPNQRGVRITAASGRTTQAALDHPFLTPSGLVLAGDLTLGMTLGNIAQPKTDSTDRYPIEGYRLAGYFIGDGCCVTQKDRPYAMAANITNVDPGIIADIDVCAAALNLTTHRKGISTYFTDGIRPWLRETGLAGLNSRTKYVFDWIFQSSNEAIAAFLGAYIDCDGSVHRRSGKRADTGKDRTDVCVDINSVSHELLIGCQRLFLRLGIQTRVRQKVGKYKDRPHVSYRLAITDMDGVARFTDLVELHSFKAGLRSRYIRTKFTQPILADPIIEIEPIENLDCRCLTVAEDHTFTADDFIVHNTYHVSERFPAWYCGRHPSDSIILASYGSDLAETSSRKVRGLIMDERWPFSTRVAPDSSAVNRWSTIDGGQLLAVGISAGATGHGAHLLAIDDPLKDRAEAESILARDTVWQWYTDVARTRLMRRAIQFVTSTRWHEDDLAGRILNTSEAHKWTVLTLPAICEAPDDPIEIKLGRKDGDALWPAWYPIEKLIEQRDVMTSRNWSSVFQGNPLPAGGDLVKAEWLEHRYDRVPSSDMTVTMALDAAAKTGIHNDFSALVVLGTTATHYYVLDIIRRKVDFPALKKMLFEAVAIHKPRAIYIEDSSNAVALIQDLKRPEHDGGGSRLPIVPVQAKGSKISRMEAQTGLLESGRVLLPADHLAKPWLLEFMRELLRLPTPPDDQMDALAIALAAASRKVGGGMFFAGLSTTGSSRTYPIFTPDGIYQPPTTPPVKAAPSVWPKGVQPAKPRLGGNPLPARW